MNPRIFVALLLIPASIFAQKPTCEDIKKAAADQNEKETRVLKAEIEHLEKLKESIRKGKASKEKPETDALSRIAIRRVEQFKKTLAGKTRREQIALVGEKTKTLAEQIEKIESSTELPPISVDKVGAFGSFGGDGVDFRVQEVIDGETFTAFIKSIVHVPNPGGIVALRPEVRISRTLFVVKGIKTKGLVDGRDARWEGHLYCSGTQKLKLISGNETVYVLEPLDVEACFKKEEKKD